MFATWEQAFRRRRSQDPCRFRSSAKTGSYYVEFRVRHPDGSLHWIAGKGRSFRDERQPLLRGALYEITERKALEGGSSR